MRMDVAIEVLEPADIDDVEPLWKALLDHISSLPGAIVPVRPSDQSWRLEREEMLRALEADAFALVARRQGVAVGYVFVIIEGPDAVWYTGEKHADLAHLCVAEGERGDGVGGRLLDAMDAELERRGVEDVEIGVDTGNDVAVRLYESRGYRPDFRIFYGSPGRKPWACLRREDEDRRAGRGRFAPPGPGAASSGPGAASSASAAASDARPAPIPDDGREGPPGARTGPRQRYVSVIGASRASADLAAKAERLGELLAERDCVVICGGRDGVMEAVAKGARRKGGVTIGILPEADRDLAAPDLTFSVCSAVGHARNLGVVASGDVVIAFGGAWGTLSEIALARTLGKPVILLETWEIAPPEGGELHGIQRVTTLDEAVGLACRQDD